MFQPGTYLKLFYAWGKSKQCGKRDHCSISLKLVLPVLCIFANIDILDSRMQTPCHRLWQLNSYTVSLKIQRSLAETFSIILKQNIDMKNWQRLFQDYFLYFCDPWLTRHRSGVIGHRPVGTDQQLQGIQNLIKIDFHQGRVIFIGCNVLKMLLIFTFIAVILCRLANWFRTILEILKSKLCHWRNKQYCNLLNKHKNFFGEWSKLELINLERGRTTHCAVSLVAKKLLHVINWHSEDNFVIWLPLWLL